MYSKRLENFKWPEQLQNHHLEKTKMFTNRESVLKAIPKNLSYLEIGVLAGDYTQEVIKEIHPRNIVLVDTFDCDDSVFTQKPPRFTAKTHLQFVTDRFSEKDDTKIIKGSSFDILPTLERTFDYIYIDADHTYEAVVSDINQSVKLLRPGGLIGLNDYILWE
jgi:predicted O-methyltransferase YrrM